MNSSFELLTTALHLDGAGPIHASDATRDFWTNMERPEFRTGQVLSVFDYTTTWNYRERHPCGDEVAVLLHGHVDLLLGRDSRETSTPLSPGWACVIPEGVWHGVRVHEPSRLLFITPTPSRTEHCDLAEEGHSNSQVGTQ